jgi:hypothetical protein
MRTDSSNLVLGRALVLATLLATIGVWSTLGVELGVLTLAGGVLVLVIFTLWNSVLNLTGESPLTLEEAVSLAAPTTEEEQTRAVLRTLKDLEYERSVGKISEQDYKELSRSYRERAKALIRAADTGMASSRERAELLVEKRLREGKKAKASRRLKQSGEVTKLGEGGDPPNAEHGSSPLPASSNEDGSTRTICPECSVRNDADAKFCKKCGVELEGEA